MSYKLIGIMSTLNKYIYVLHSNHKVIIKMLISLLLWICTYMARSHAGTVTIYFKTTIKHKFTQKY